jgi:hypothetical protein
MGSNQLAEHESSSDAGEAGHGAGTGPPAHCAATSLVELPATEAKTSLALHARRWAMIPPIEWPTAWTRAGLTQNSVEMAVTTFRRYVRSGPDASQYFQPGPEPAQPVRGSPVVEPVG